MLSLLLYTLFTYDCSSSSLSTHVIKLADDTTVLGLNTGNDETAYRQEIQLLAAWCSSNNLALNTKKIKEVIGDFRTTGQLSHSPLLIGNEVVERASSFKFLA